MSRYLVDTNILMRAADSRALQQVDAIRSVVSLLRSRHVVHICPQNVVEFWAVATRPTDANGLGWSREVAARARARMLRLFPLVPEDDRIFTEWVALIDKHQISGKRVHDARLVAVMLANGIGNLLTFNVEDCGAFHEIVVIHPSQVAP